MSYSILLSTFPNSEEAKTILTRLLEEKKVACGNILSGMESMFWWEGKVQAEKETLLIIKTASQNVDNVIECIQKWHSYDVPEVLSFSVEKGNKDYLQWISNSLA